MDRAKQLGCGLSSLSLRISCKGTVKEVEEEGLGKGSKTVYCAVSNLISSWYNPPCIDVIMPHLPITSSQFTWKVYFKGGSSSYL